MRKIIGTALGALVGVLLAAGLDAWLGAPADEAGLFDALLIDLRGPLPLGLLGGLIGALVSFRFAYGLGQDQEVGLRATVGALGGLIAGAIYGLIVATVSGAVVMIAVGHMNEDALLYSMGGAFGGFIFGSILGAFGGVVVGGAAGSIVGGVCGAFGAPPPPPKPDIRVGENEAEDMESTRFRNASRETRSQRKAREASARPSTAVGTGTMKAAPSSGSSPVIDPNATMRMKAPPAVATNPDFESTRRMVVKPKKG